jgi:hypothetical protein
VKNEMIEATIRVTISKSFNCEAKRLNADFSFLLEYH